MSQDLKYTRPKLVNKAVDQDGLDFGTARKFSEAPLDFKLMNSGVGCGLMIEPVPLYRRAPAENVIKNQRNAWIVLGVDRRSTKTTGYGGKGNTQCAAIDIVVGRLGKNSRTSTLMGAPIRVNPNFKIDAARIYLSQKSDIDEYFELPHGMVGNPTAKSAVAVKADEVRLIARGGIKLVTGTDSRTSQGTRQLGMHGIDLIGGGDTDDMQPLVKGNNLIDALKALIEKIKEIREITCSFLQYQMEINAAFLSHTHQGSFYGITTSPSFTAYPQAVRPSIQLVAQTQMSNVSNIVNLEAVEMNYVDGDYILSDNNHTN